MIKLNINNMELPVFDIIQATPFCIPLKKGFNLYFEIPTVNEYFIFESKYLRIIHKYFVLFSNVNFLELSDFKSDSLKEAFLKELKFALQNKKFKNEFREIITIYFTADFKIKKIMDVADIFQLCYLVMFVHCIIENVKSFFFTGGSEDGGAGKGDIGDLFYFFESTFNKNRTEILAMRITYAMLMLQKHNAKLRADAKRYPKPKNKGRK